MLRWILLCALSSLMCSPVFGQANVYNQLTRTAAETTDSADVWIPIWDQQATPRKSFKISVAELFKEPKAVVITSGTLTDSAPAMDITQTWNDGTEAFTGWKLNVTDTASAAASKLLDLQIAGSSKFAITKAGYINTSYVANTVTQHVLGGWNSGSDGNGPVLNGTQTGSHRISRTSSSTSAGVYLYQIGAETTQLVGRVGLGGTTVQDPLVFLEGDAADILAQRRTTNPQSFKLYRDFTNTSNYSRAIFGFHDNASFAGTAGTTLRIGTEKAGTPSVGGVSLVTDGVERFTLASTSSTLTAPGGSGNIVLGANGVLRTQYINDASNSVSSFELSGLGHVTFSVGTTAPLFRFAGTTSSFPALKRSGTELQARLADDSAFAPVSVGTTTITGGTITTSSKPTIDATQTWNDAAATFTAFKQNITDTASGVSSLLFDWQVGGVSYLKLTKFGDLVGSAFTGTDFSIRMQNGSLKQGSSTITAWGSSNAAGSMDTALARSAAGIVKFTNASTGAGMIQLQEVASAPSAPAADNVIIYAIDNGSGKTQLMALFSSGAAQEIAIAP